MGSFDFAQDDTLARVTIWKDFRPSGAQETTACVKAGARCREPEIKSGEPKLPQVKRTEAMFK
jgi:hypothetical protein